MNDVNSSENTNNNSDSRDTFHEQGRQDYRQGYSVSLPLPQQKGNLPSSSSANRKYLADQEYKYKAFAIAGLTIAVFVTVEQFFRLLRIVLWNFCRPSHSCIHLWRLAYIAEMVGVFAGAVTGVAFCAISLGKNRSPMAIIGVILGGLCTLFLLFWIGAHLAGAGLYF